MFTFWFWFRKARVVPESRPFWQTFGSGPSCFHIEWQVLRPILKKHSKWQHWIRRDLEVESNLKMCLRNLRNSPAIKFTDEITVCEGFEAIMVCVQILVLSFTHSVTLLEYCLTSLNLGFFKEQGRLSYAVGLKMNWVTAIKSLDLEKRWVSFYDSIGSIEFCTVKLHSGQKILSEDGARSDRKRQIVAISTEIVLSL